MGAVHRRRARRGRIAIRLRRADRLSMPSTARIWPSEIPVRVLAAVDRQAAAQVARRHRCALSSKSRRARQPGPHDRHTPCPYGIHSMATDTARDWLTSAWRRGLVITMPEPPSGCLLEGPLWALTQHGRDRLRSPVVAAISRFPWLRVLSIFVAAGGGIYTWINAHANVAGVISIWLVIAALYVLGLWLLVRLFEAKEAPIGLVAIETHRAKGTLPSLLGAE
jgi:hypothetical protein